MQDQRDLSFYIEAWRERLERQESQRRQRARSLHQVAQECVRRLVQEFGATKVYLFVSLARQSFVHDRSDVDLAVEGLDGKLYWNALSSLWALLPEGVELDLVPLESAWSSLAERVRTEGELLDLVCSR